MHNNSHSPRAEGYGKYTVGGRGGKVIEVTNLNDSGKDSLRTAKEAQGPRTVVFRVSGTIDLKRGLRINNPYITIAGQTAPGDGICLKRYPLMISADQVIVRYIRVRLGDESGKDSDAVSSRFTRRIILDHVSASWSVDETMSVYHCDSITVQWCIVSESMFNSNHVKGAHGYGGIWGSNYGSYHHNLIAHHSNRNIRFASGSGNTDYRNNVMAGSEEVTDDNWKGIVPSLTAIKGVQEHNPSNLEAIPGLKLDKPWPAMAISQQTAEEAYHSDHDGMPDEWEEEQGLDKNDPADRNQLAPDGYTMLEKYLNSIQ